MTVEAKWKRTSLSSIHDGDRGWSPSLGGGWGEPAGSGVGLAADIGQQHVRSNETIFATSRLIFFSILECGYDISSG